MYAGLECTEIKQHFKIFSHILEGSTDKVHTFHLPVLQNEVCNLSFLPISIYIV